MPKQEKRVPEQEKGAEQRGQNEAGTVVGKAISPPPSFPRRQESPTGYRLATLTALEVAVAEVKPLRLAFTVTVSFLPLAEDGILRYLPP